MAIEGGVRHSMAAGNRYRRRALRGPDRAYRVVPGDPISLDGRIAGIRREDAGRDQGRSVPGRPERQDSLRLNHMNEAAPASRSGAEAEPAGIRRGRSLLPHGDRISCRAELSTVSPALLRAGTVTKESG